MRPATCAAVGFLLLLSTSLLPVVAGAPHQDLPPLVPEGLPSFGLATGPGNQLSPDLEGHFLVWEDDRSGNVNVRFKDLATSQETWLGSSNTRRSRFPQIRDGLVSFVDAPPFPIPGDGGRCGDVYYCAVLYDATTGVFRVYDVLDGLAPVATTEDYFVTFQTFAAPGHCCFVQAYRSLDGTKAFGVGPGWGPDGLRNGPIGGDDVVALSVRDTGYWGCPGGYPGDDPKQGARWCTSELGVIFVQNHTFMYLTRSIVVADRYDPYGDFRWSCLEDFTRESYPRLSGSLVVWQDNRKSAFVLNEPSCTWTGDRWDVYGFDLAAWREVPLLVHPWNETHPDLDGDLLVWGDDRNGNWDVYAKFLDTGEEFQVTDDPSTQRNPVVSGSCLAWEDNRNGDWDIYGTCLGAPHRSVTLDVGPDTLNLRSRARWVNAYVDAVNATVSDIDRRTLRLNGIRSSLTRTWDGTLVARFNWTAFAATVVPGTDVVVTLTGRWKDGGTFTATDTIRVINPGWPPSPDFRTRPQG